MEVHSMYYKVKFKKSVTVTTDSGRQITFQKGEKVKATQRPGKAWIALLPSGETARINRDTFRFKQQITNHSEKYDRATAEAWINNRGTASDTKYLLWCNKYQQRGYIFQGSAGNWKLIKRINLCSGSIANGQGSDTKISFKYKIYDKQQKFKGPHGFQYWNQHFSSPYGNSIHYRGGSKKGKPLSHGCLTSGKPGSQWMFKMLPVGTRVVVY